jgi:aerobic carbon-monoxide dehydrogenase small subunit
MSDDPLLGLQELAKRAHNPPADQLARLSAIMEETMGQVRIKINGRSVSREVEDRTLLVEFLRETLGLTGTHVGCDTGQCGACVIHLDGRAVKSCTMLAAQATGSDIVTIEGLAKGDELHPVQAAFREHHALQCGFCTPGMIMTAVDLLNRHPNPDEDTIRTNLDGNLCRCTGYHNIVKAIAAAAGPYAAMARAIQPAE